MSCGPNISIAISLIALTGGIWFLYKTQKENLGILYKVSAWAIIIGALLNVACCGLRCGLRCERICGKKQQCMSMQSCGMMNNCGMMSGCAMAGNCCAGMERGMMGGGMNCCMMKKSGFGKMRMNRCKMKKEECCQEMEEDRCEVKREIVKDTVSRRK